jgi:hypothetical protein
MRSRSCQARTGSKQKNRAKNNKIVATNTMQNPVDGKIQENKTRWREETSRVASDSGYVK